MFSVNYGFRFILFYWRSAILTFQFHIDTICGKWLIQSSNFSYFLMIFNDQSRRHEIQRTVPLRFHRGELTR